MDSPINYEIEKIKELLENGFYVKLPIHGYNEEIFQRVRPISDFKLAQHIYFFFFTINVYIAFFCRFDF